MQGKKMPNLLEPLNERSKVKKVIGVCSGKGGVGKSAVSAILAVQLRNKGYKVAIMDADITGPSIPKMFGVHEKVYTEDEKFLIPGESKTGIKMISINLLLPNEESPVIWRGPVISGVIKQFWSEVIWDDIDIMIIDMPPGTGDVSLTVFQSIPLDGLILVTTPQDLVNMIVKKSLNMAKMMGKPLLGIIENMSYIECPHCGERTYIFNNSDIKKNYEVPLLAELPIDTTIPKLADAGDIESYVNPVFDEAVKAIENI